MRAAKEKCRVAASADYVTDHDCYQANNHVEAEDSSQLDPGDEGFSAQEVRSGQTESSTQHESSGSTEGQGECEPPGLHSTSN